MKSNKVFRPAAGRHEADDMTRKAVKLPPIKKSGKEKHLMYSSLEDDSDDDELDMYKQKESVLDYYDDEEEDL